MFIRLKHRGILIGHILQKGRQRWLDVAALLYFFTDNRENHPGRVFLLNLQLAFIIASSHVSGLTSTAMTIHGVMLVFLCSLQRLAQLSAKE